MNKNKAYTFICRKLLNIKTVPAGCHNYLLKTTLILIFNNINLFT
jgi:hypothetical protein